MGEKHLGLLVDILLNLKQQCALVVNGILDYIRNSVASRTRDHPSVLSLGQDTTQLLC